MRHLRSGNRTTIKLVIACCIAAVAACTTARAAEPVSEAKILQALTPKSLTRNLSGTRTPQEIQRQNFINGLRTKTRSLSADERTEVATIAKERPSIDLEIYFDYNSAEIANRAVPDLMNLGRALTNAALQGGVFLVSGHTDAKGGMEYNQQLSERRAQAVKTFLMKNFGVAGNSLVSAGYGKEQLKNTANPFAAENRRVQITNLQTKQEAGN